MRILDLLQGSHQSALSQVVASAESEDHFLLLLAEATVEQFGADSADIFLIEPNGGLRMKMSTSVPEYVNRCRLGPGIGVCGKVMASGEPLFIEVGAGKHPDNVAYPGVDELDKEGMAVLPFDSEGVIVIFKNQRWKLSAADKLAMASFVSKGHELWSVFRHGVRIGSMANRIGAVSEVSRTIASSPYLEEILQLLVNITAQQFGYIVCTVRLLDEARGELVLRATQAPAKAYQRKPAIKLGESIAGQAIKENRPIVVPDVQFEPTYIGHDLAAEQGLRSMICIPLTVQDIALGVMSCYTSDPHEFSEDEISALETIAKQAAFSIQHAKLQVRNTLMQEMHHRVKNNLQQVASLLRLQISHGSYKSLEEALTDSLSRILAISAVHELLSREDLDHVGMKTLAESLVQHQRDSLILPDRHIQFEVRGDDVHLNTMQATQVALILNELILNAVEHGFRVSESGDIHVTVEDKAREIGLWVSNNGDALPPDFDITAVKSLGLKIVDNLSKALGGKFLLEDRLGWTVAEVKFTRVGSE